jgi:hypothetical protein
VDEPHHRVAPAGFKYLVTEMLCWATGGLQKYTGSRWRTLIVIRRSTGDEREAFLNEALEFAQRGYPSQISTSYQQESPALDLNREVYAKQITASPRRVQLWDRVW